MMTDEKIIKALECCTKIEEGCSHEYCFECPMFEEDVDECTASLFGKVLDLIKRQQAEIERYKTLYEDLKAENLETIKAIKDYKTEAIKEFAESVKAHMCNYDIDNYHSFRAIEEEVFDDLVKELTEGSNGE